MGAWRRRWLSVVNVDNVEVRSIVSILGRLIR